MACSVPGVVGCHAVRTRGPEAQVYVDLHVQVTPGTTVEEGHAIAHQVEGALRLRYGQITDVVVHLEPAGRVAAPRRGEVDYREQRSSREAP